MTIRQSLVAPLFATLLGACHSAPPAVLSPSPIPASADSSSKVTHDSARAAPRFFRNLPYGTDAQFNPLSVFINHGFDQLRVVNRQDITAYPYGASARAVLHAMVDPATPIRHYGVRNWVRNELLPLTLKSQGGGQWYPNYTLHLFGTGVTYVRLIDWYRDHGFVDHAQLAAGATTYGYHLLVEMIENGPEAYHTVDALTDLLVFDPAAIVLWNQGWVRRLFSDPIEVTDWYGQISLGLPGRTVENAYSLVVLRAPLPKSTNWKLLVTHGYVFMVGPSRRIGANDWLTFAGGADAPATPVIDAVTGKKTADLEPNAGVFYDRQGSLIASLVTRSGKEDGLTLNVYPGLLQIGPVRPSFWIQHNRSGGVRFGVSSALGLGLSTRVGVPKD